MPPGAWLCKRELGGFGVRVLSLANLPKNGGILPFIRLLLATIAGQLTWAAGPC